jgi:hypothetical protein
MEGSPQQQQQQQAWMDQVQAQLAQLQQQNQQLAAQLAQQPAPSTTQPKLPKPKPWDGKGDIMTLANATEAQLRQTGETVQRYHTPASTSGPTPMEINMVGAGQPFMGTCFKCGKRGHKQQDCNWQRQQSGGKAGPTRQLPKN